LPLVRPSPPAGAESPLRVAPLRGHEALAAATPAWEELAANALEPNPFYEPWLLLPALECFGAGAAVEVVAVWSGERLDAIVPLERQRRFKGFPLRAAATWRHRHCMLGTPLLRAGRAAASLQALFEWLRADEGGAAVLALNYIPEGAFLHALVDALAAADLCALTTDSYNRALLRRERDAEVCLASLSRHERQELRRRERRLGELGKVSHVALRAGDDIVQRVEEFLRLEAAGWKGQEGSALACSDANRRFAHEIFAAAFRRGRLHMAGLDLDGRPLARCTSILAGAGSYAFKTAYDEQFARFSPGVIAEIDRIRHIHEMPEVQWMDSFTAPGNTVLNRLWKGRIGVHNLAIGTHRWGEAAVAALPLARWAKRLFRRPATS
jgi:CelD/BcsL family acetyltransferase involved in cellulose biosynthesis